MTNALRHLREDVAAVRARDPAARTAAEAILCSPGLHALWAHRLLHAMYTSGEVRLQRNSSTRGHTLRLLARIGAHLVRALTGVEIHPGATIGRRVVIDHGHGVVIGETAVVGDDCTLYHGVTLGGTANAPVKRHPTLEKGVLVGASATLLGPITIGAHARVGAGAVVVEDVAANTTVVGPRARHADETKPLRVGRRVA